MWRLWLTGIGLKDEQIVMLRPVGRQDGRL
jgi:hypothetical protein